MRRLFSLFFLAVIGCGSSTTSEVGTGASEVTTDDAATTCVPCTDRFPEGANKYIAARKSCFCTSDVCYDECQKTACDRPSNTTAPDAACQTCIDLSYGLCTKTVQLACESDEDCMRYVLCRVDSTCEGERVGP